MIWMKTWTKMKGWICNMSEFVFLIIGILIGCCFGLSLMSCLQLNRVNDYEEEIRKLKKQLREEKAKNNI